MTTQYEMRKTSHQRLHVHPRYLCEYVSGRRPCDFAKVNDHFCAKHRNGEFAPPTPAPVQRRRTSKPVSDDPALRWCVGCRAFHNIRAFQTNRSLRDGLQPSCREFYYKNRHGKRPCDGMRVVDVGETL